MSKLPTGGGGAPPSLPRALARTPRARGAWASIFLEEGPETGVGELPAAVLAVVAKKVWPSSL